MPSWLQIMRLVNSVLKLIVVLIVLALPIAYFCWLRGQDSAFREFRTNLMSASVASSLTTSFARVDVFQVQDKSNRWYPVNTFGNGVDPQWVDLKEREVRAFCSRTYEVTIGYPQFQEQVRAALVDGAVLPLPQVLSVNVVNATDWPKDASKQCLRRFDGDSPTALVKDALVTDALWETHSKGGAVLLVEASRRVLPECEAGKACDFETLQKKRAALFALNEIEFREHSRCAGETEPKSSSAACEAAREQMRVAKSSLDNMEPMFEKGVHAAALYADAGEASKSGPLGVLPVLGLEGGGGYEGTIVLTMSSLAVMGAEKRVRLAWVIPLWKNEAFYFRRELAEVTFGTYVGRDALRKSRIPFVRPRLVLEVSDPSAVSINRRVVAQGISGKVDLLENGGRSLSAEANDGILQSLRQAIRSYAPAAEEISRRIIRDRYETDDLAVQFKRARGEPTNTVFIEGT